MFWFRTSIGVAMLVVASSGATAATGNVTGRVDRILIDDADFGGCMARVTSNIGGALPVCSASWVTFDCLVGFPETSKSLAQSKLSMAQLAMATGKQVFIEATDTRRANGYCLATRVDLID